MGPAIFSFVKLQTGLILSVFLLFEASYMGDLDAVIGKLLGDLGSSSDIFLKNISGSCHQYRNGCDVSTLANTLIYQITEFDSNVQPSSEIFVAIVWKAYLRILTNVWNVISSETCNYVCRCLTTRLREGIPSFIEAQTTTRCQLLLFFSSMASATLSHCIHVMREDDALDLLYLMQAAKGSLHIRKKQSTDFDLKAANTSMERFITKSLNYPPSAGRSQEDKQDLVCKYRTLHRERFSQSATRHRKLSNFGSSGNATMISASRALGLAHSAIFDLENYFTLTLSDLKVVEEAERHEQKRRKIDSKTDLNSQISNEDSRIAGETMKEGSIMFHLQYVRQCIDLVIKTLTEISIVYNSIIDDTEFTIVLSRLAQQVYLFTFLLQALNQLAQKATTFLIIYSSFSNHSDCSACCAVNSVRYMCF